MSEITPLVYSDAGHLGHHGHLLPAVEGLLRDLMPSRVFDLGCGNGSIGNRLSQLSAVTGVDPSPEGISIAQEAYPHLTLRMGSAYDDLAAVYGQFPAVVSLEVVEHLYAPRRFAEVLFDLVEPGGVAIVSTPYHGYLKNLALALTNRFDRHLDPLWDGGHIKFWSEATLRRLLSEAGFSDIHFMRTGRLPPFAKSMVAVARKA